MPSLKKILLVDDSALDLELAVDALRSSKLVNEIVTFRDGAEVLDFLFERGKYSGRGDGLPGLLLLDLKMPKIDGLAVLREIKADPRLKSLPVVMMTSSREEQDLVNSYKLGVNAYVVKPVTFHEFADAVKQIGLFWVLLNELPPDSSVPTTSV